MCWEWRGYIHPVGYGQTSWSRNENFAGGRVIFCHRAAWILTFGPIVDNLYICHTCDNRKCCNPAHLFLGTQRANLADMTAKGRRVNAQRKGFAPTSAKLTNAIATQIRDEFAKLPDDKARKRKAPGETLKLAQKFGIHKNYVHRIVFGRAWVNVQEA